MKRALQGILIAGEKMKDDVLTGKKRITIREGHRDYTTGPVLLGCHILNWATLRTITNVRHTTLKEVTSREYRADGFELWHDMFFGLSQFYPTITEDSNVTIVEWE